MWIKYLCLVMCVVSVILGIIRFEQRLNSFWEKKHNKFVDFFVWFFVLVFLVTGFGLMIYSLWINPLLFVVFILTLIMHSKYKNIVWEYYIGTGLQAAIFFIMYWRI